ncbi:hypothetical protein ACFJGX_09325 [Hydrogenophaga sp. UC242_50]|uniref:hypothetical protein n=1 Tax=Hydrogenophaga sp. UC242_50 TaxID=3350169 RepID=UPI0036D20C1E
MPATTASTADVLVLQHLFEDGPGFLGEWLDAQGLPWHLRCAEAGELYPASVRGYRGLAVLGGAWSANDERPTLRQAEALIREADALGIPVIGHCLGGAADGAGLGRPGGAAAPARDRLVAHRAPRWRCRARLVR